MSKIFLFAALLVMTVMGSFGAFFLKKASGFAGLKDLLTNKNLYIGAFLYALSAVINIFLLKFLDYSVVLPFTSITYVWTMLISYFILKEKITVLKAVGVCLITAGCIALVL